MPARRKEASTRRATKDDAAAIAALAEELGYSSSAREINSRLRKLTDSDLILVAVDDDNRLLGFIQGHTLCVIEAGFRVEILGLVVSSRARRAGLGKRLVAEVEDWARTSGAEAVLVRSNTKRVESHLFYPALGYQTIKTQSVYKKAL
ncbi:MAG: GNAT family N-acetyltransferase [Chthoniobacterales bacterium]|nr:MAG: GNAT family N-acetyltransferase [Chthoniobacterales bacterium]